MGKKLYFECNTGISGDMTVAALLDLGADEAVLNKALNSLKEKVTGFDVKISDIEKSGIIVKDFDVILDSDNHDHDMEYLYGHEHGAEFEHHHHEHRSLKDVIDIINIADITDGARELAIKIFTIVAQAESAVHGRSIDEVHFHEVGAIDSIVDIISAAVCYDDIVKKYDIEGTVINRLVDGTGTVRCQHGILPVPVPAVLKIAEQTGIPISISNRRGEYVTPTGAAFAAAVMSEDKLPESMRIIKTGLGAGKREQEVPGIVRAMIIE